MEPLKVIRHFSRMADVILENKRLNPKLTRRVSVSAITPRSEVKTPQSESGDIPEDGSRTVMMSSDVFEKGSEGEEGHKIVSHDEEVANLRRMTRLMSIIPAQKDDDLGIEIEQKKESPYSALNTPMLITWLNKHHDELQTALSGLKFIYKHAQTGDGCVLLLKYGVLRVLFKVQKYEGYRDNKELQLLCVNIFKQLLECNYTREPLILTVDVLKTTFAIGGIFLLCSFSFTCQSL